MFINGAIRGIYKFKGIFHLLVLYKKSLSEPITLLELLPVREKGFELADLDRKLVCNGNDSFLSHGMKAVYIANTDSSMAIDL
jgi:hypothetical protein